MIRPSWQQARPFARIIAPLCVALAVSACADPAEPPSIVLISIDTLRRDHVSAYGYQRSTTPRIDALAAEGALFLNAVSTSNWTLPSHMSLMTGLPPSLHRVEDDGSRLPAALRTLAETLDENEYATAGFTSHVFLGEQFGFARGFEHYSTQWNHRAENVTDQAIDWLEKTGRDPCFLFVHYFDPHWNYDPPEPFASRFGLADSRYGDIEYLKRHLDPADPLPAEVLDDVLRLYDGEIAYTDHHVGRLLDWLRERGRLDRTIIAIVSDHGEEFSDHGGFGHGTHLHGEVTRVPFVLRYPERVEAGKRSELATLSDVPLTLLRLAGLSVPDQFRLRAVDLSTPTSEKPDRITFLESTRWGPKRFAALGSTHKLMTPGSYSPVFPIERKGRKELKRLGPYALEPALYDIASDLAERENLASRTPRSAAGAELELGLAEYFDGNLQAVKMTFTGSGPAADYTVQLRPDGGFLDEPFCVDAQAAFALLDLGSTETAEALSSTEVNLTVRWASDPVTLYVPLDAQSHELFVQVGRNGGSTHEATVALPEAGESAVVPFVGSDAPQCVVERIVPRLDASFEAVDLGEEDLERLRSLGYVR